MIVDIFGEVFSVGAENVFGEVFTFDTEAETTSPAAWIYLVMMQ